MLHELLINFKPKTSEKRSGISRMRRGNSPNHLVSWTTQSIHREGSGAFWGHRRTGCNALKQSLCHSRRLTAIAADDIWACARLTTQNSGQAQTNSSQESVTQQLHIVFTPQSPKPTISQDGQDRDLVPRIIVQPLLKQDDEATRTRTAGKLSHRPSGFGYLCHTSPPDPTHAVQKLQPTTGDTRASFRDVSAHCLQSHPCSGCGTTATHVSPPPQTLGEKIE